MLVIWYVFEILTMWLGCLLSHIKLRSFQALCSTLFFICIFIIIHTHKKEKKQQQKKNKSKNKNKNKTKRNETKQNQTGSTLYLRELFGLTYNTDLSFSLIYLLMVVNYYSLIFDIFWIECSITIMVNDFSNVSYVKADLYISFSNLI